MELSYSLLGQKYYWQEPSAPLLGQKTWRTPSDGNRVCIERVSQTRALPYYYLGSETAVRSVAELEAPGHCSEVLVGTAQGTAR
jgi:hypothetical protein